MKPIFNPPPPGDVAGLIRELTRLVLRLGEGCEGKVIDRVAIATTTTRVPHGLRVVPRWRVFNQEADARIWQSQAPDTTYLYLQASAAVTAGIEVF
jgi:hypothetical protein